LHKSRRLLSKHVAAIVSAPRPARDADATTEISPEEKFTAGDWAGATARVFHHLSEGAGFGDFASAMLGVLPAKVVERLYTP
jgi:hypothetical protein